MFNSLSAEQVTVLREAIANCDLVASENEIVALAQSAICFEPLPLPSESSSGEPLPKESAPGESPPSAFLSRFGGLPDVPPDWSWPEDVLFYAQLDLAQLAACDFNHRLPESGLLSFFASNEIEAPTSGLLCHVFYFPDISVLSRAKAPPGFVPAGLSYGQKEVFRAQSINPFSQITLPSGYSNESRALEEVLDNDRYYELQSQLRRPSIKQVRGNRAFMFEAHQVFGYHGFVDGDMADVLGLSAADLEQDEWVLLLQLESDGTMDWSFWDAGRFLFAIAVQDLKNRRFDRVRGGLWSS